MTVVRSYLGWRLVDDIQTRNMREDELVAFGSVEEFERYENDDIQDKFDEDREIESGSDCCDGGCSNDEGNGDACHEDSDCDVGDGDGSDDSDASTTAARLIEKKNSCRRLTITTTAVSLPTCSASSKRHLMKQWLTTHAKHLELADKKVPCCFEL
ncbi:hypothetical protein EMCRGX_G000012 [Ephydatia muelleri]